MQRELSEEVQLSSAYQEFRDGLIYDPSNDVGKVHLGVVHRFVLEQPHVQSNEADLSEGGFVSVDELLEDFDTSGDVEPVGDQSTVLSYVAESFQDSSSTQPS